MPRSAPLRIFLVFSICLISLTSVASFAQGGLPPIASVVTRSYDQVRSGSNLNETVLITSIVNTASFGQDFSGTVDVDIYAHPPAEQKVTIGDTAPKDIDIR